MHEDDATSHKEVEAGDAGTESKAIHFDKNNDLFSFGWRSFLGIRLANPLPHLDDTSVAGDDGDAMVVVVEDGELH